MSNSPSLWTHCASFLEDPLSAIKIFVPAAALEVLLHKRVWQKTSLRDLTLYLAITNTYWFATTLNLSFLETPLFLQSSHLTEQQKLDCARQRFNWLNKLEIVVGTLGLDLFWEWRKRILDNHGSVDGYLCKAMWIPAAIAAIQAVYLLPDLNRRAKQQQSRTSEQLPQVHHVYIGFESVKIIGLAVAGIRFSKMLTL